MLNCDLARQLLTKNVRCESLLLGERAGVSKTCTNASRIGAVGPAECGFPTNFRVRHHAALVVGPRTRMTCLQLRIDDASKHIMDTPHTHGSRGRKDCSQIALQSCLHLGPRQSHKITLHAKLAYQGVAAAEQATGFGSVRGASTQVQQHSVPIRQLMARRCGM